jgi:fumarate reductase subunit D
MDCKGNFDVSLLKAKIQKLFLLNSVSSRLWRGSERTHHSHSFLDLVHAALAAGLHGFAGPVPARRIRERALPIPGSVSVTTS